MVSRRHFLNYWSSRSFRLVSFFFLHPFVSLYLSMFHLAFASLNLHQSVYCLTRFFRGVWDCSRGVWYFHPTDVLPPPMSTLDSGYPETCCGLWRSSYGNPIPIDNENYLSPALSNLTSSFYCKTSLPTPKLTILVATLLPSPPFYY